MSDDTATATDLATPTIATTAEAPPLRAHSNENLLKIDTYDKYSTLSAIKKQIGKALGNKVHVEARPLFKGMQRMNKNPKTPFLFLAFETPQDREAALALLQQVTHRGNAWKEVPVTDRDLALTHKGSVKRQREGPADDTSKLTQYEKYPIAEQLELKKKHCLRVMKIIVPTRPHGWDAHSKRFLGIVESPQLEGYRNHVNLSFGHTAAGEPSLGFMTGSLMEGRSTIDPAVEPDKDVLTMSAAAKVVAVAVMQVCREFRAEGLEVFDKVKGTGFWRKLQVRHNVEGEMMVDAELDEDSAPAELFTKVCERLAAALTSAETTERLKTASGLVTAKVTSVQYHKQTGISSPGADPVRVVLHGAATLTETLAGLKYELSPTAFFQVNTPCTERMLAKVQSVVELTPTTTLLDLCSGTGTIGLTLARYVKRVIGIELLEPAVENARRNALRNGITNADFRCGRVENLLPDAINGLSTEDRKDIVAILDPPRAGVNGTVLKWIRGTPTIRRVVYISCEQRALERDCPALTKPPTKAYRGTPFEVTAGFAIDLFPHTHHVEMVAVLTRCPEPEEASGHAEAVAVAEDGEEGKEGEDANSGKESDEEGNEVKTARVEE